jgi:hypothetical protein
MDPKVTWLTVRRRCLVCDAELECEEAADTPDIGVPCALCSAPSERISVLRRRVSNPDRNVHAAALGRLGGLKGGIARAERLTAEERSQIAKKAARTRWNKRVKP